jgi:hypothetical protein
LELGGKSLLSFLLTLCLAAAGRKVKHDFEQQEQPSQSRNYSGDAE